ncbi:MAG: PAS domain S-box protein [Chloroflexaceae bacterium]|nr:PAS domain S-box protein [Chloroflexaceae bacterium]
MMNYTLADLIDTTKLQEMMDAFYDVTAAPTAILDADGTVLTATAWQDICTKYHRVNTGSLLRCQQSDAYIADHLINGSAYALYECANGLVDVASPILVDGVHIGTIFTGQFLLAEPDTDRFRQQAHAFGFDEGGYLQALDQVPVVQRDRIEPILRYLSLFATMLAEIGLQRMQQLETQRELKESEQRFRMAQFSLDNVSDGVQWLNPEGRHIYVNQALCRQIGYTQEEMLGMGLDQIDPNIDIAQWRREVWPLIKERGSTTFQVIHQHKDGSLIPVEVTGNYMQFEGQEYLCTFARDVSERKQQEAELRTFKALADNALDGIAMASLDARLIYMNPAFKAMAGLDAQAQGIPVIDLYPAETQHAIEQEVIPTLMHQGAWQGMLEMCRPDGSRWIAQQSAFAVRDEHGQIIKLANLLRDVTEQRRIDMERQRLVAIVEKSNDFMGIASLEGQAIYLNDAGKRLVGLESEATFRQTQVIDYFPPDEQRRVQQEILPTIFQDGRWKGECRFRHFTTGELIPVEWNVFLIRDHTTHEPISIATVTRDLREQKQGEAERTALQEQIIDAQRDALRELSTPLIPISDHVVIMPLIGTIDSQRAEQVMETLLDGVARHRADLVIVDITGVLMVDTQVAQAFIQAAQAVKLLGAEVMLTGIQPQIAQTLVHLGVDLHGIQTRGSLQSGITAALSQNNRSQVRGHRSEVIPNGVNRYET